MTYEEAIHNMKNNCWSIDAECSCKNVDCDDCHIAMAIEALEKQMPKKPINPTDEDGFTVFWNCPSCDIQSTDDDVKYCPTCGQAIDWSDEE